MATVKHFSFQYANLPPPFKIKQHYEEDIKNMPHKHDEYLWAVINQQPPVIHKIQVYPDNRKHWLEFMINKVMMQFDSVLNIDNVHGEENFKECYNKILINN